MSREEMEARGWDQLDVLFISGDAYIDHPSFGVALLGRWLEAKGYRVGVVAQPGWDSLDDIARMGRPRLFAGVTAGTLDSMLAHYTAFRKKRSDDAYTPGGRAGARPNRASIVYANLARQAFPGLPIVLGGVEASLRRASHYDFWTDKIRRSLLLDSKADLLVYGMGERAITEVADRLRDAGEERAPDTLHGIRGTAYAASSLPEIAAEDLLELPSHEAILADPTALMTATLAIERQVHQGKQWAAQACGGRQVIFTPPAAGLDTEAMDALYAMPYTRNAHPAYAEPIPAARMIQFSVTAHRGCAGGCTFCSITLHQGRDIQSRSADSIKEEVRAMTRHPEWNGSVSDVGGPTANMWGAYCADDPSACRRPDCLTPKVCEHFRTKEPQLIELLNSIKAMEGVKHLRIASGVRYDLNEDNGPYLRALVSEFVGGQLKIAPEHCSDKVLRLMRKPKFETFQAFLDLFQDESMSAGKEQYVSPYLITAFPGCTAEDMRGLAGWLEERGWRPQQVQCFIPTPGTVATAMYHGEITPHGTPIRVAKSDKARLKQHRILMPDTGAPPGAGKGPYPKRRGKAKRLHARR